jgi:hypothetical protein
MGMGPTIFKGVTPKEIASEWLRENGLCAVEYDLMSTLAHEDFASGGNRVVLDVNDFIYRKPVIQAKN